ncbi:MAG: toll/interleukin-1 receptor domain-containing protein [Pseudomonadota bacterium]
MNSLANATPSPPPHAAQSGWARLFGYDIFISFALGPAPRGCRAYASDLARRLRERGFTVFFSEDEAPVGAALDSTLRRALRSSRILVVVANRGTLAEPRWVRTEVEEYRRMRPGGTLVPISVDGALQDPALTESTQDWLPFADRIWVDETAEACDSGRVSDEAVQRLATAPHAVRSLARLRIAVGTALIIFALLALFATLQSYLATQERDRARQGLLASSARQALLLSRDGRAHEGWNGLVEALVQAQPQVDGQLPEGFLEAALTTLVENRRGPDLVFDTRAPAPPRLEDGDLTPPPTAFDARGVRVAVAAGAQLAVWSTVDGQRLTQVTLPFVAERLTFAGGGSLVVAEGAEPAPEGNEGRATSRAVSVDVLSGRVTALSLALCEQWIPCIASEGPTTQLLPLVELPVGGLPANTGYVAASEGAMRVKGMSGKQLVLLSSESANSPPTWWLLDRHSGRKLQLKLRLHPTDAEMKDEADTFSLANDAPVLVASRFMDPTMVVYRIEAGPAGPRLVEPRTLKARLAEATQGVQLDAQGTKLRYQNLRYGTGTGVGLGRTVVMDVASGRELWARGEGTVAWSEPLIALQEYGAETQLLSADTGATWFMAPGQPLGFDPTGRMLLMWDTSEDGVQDSPWPRVRLLEALPVHQFGRDAQGPASERSACVPPAQLRFLTLAERPDRLWNSDDWHRVALPSQKAEVASAAPTSLVSMATSTMIHRVSLTADDERWRLQVDENNKGILLGRLQLQRQFPLLTADLRSGKDLGAMLTTSADGRWSAVVAAVSDDDNVCKGWARWRLHRGQDPAVVMSGCTRGELPGADNIPAVWFFAADTQAGTPLLAAVPADTCRYDLLEPESGKVRGAVVPAFGNDVRIERLTPDLLAVHSTDWYGATLAYQLQGLDSTQPGPIFMLADRNKGNEARDGAATEVVRSRPISDARVLVEDNLTPEEEPNDLLIAFARDGRTLHFQENSRTTSIGVPPWGERLRERLRQAVQAKLGKM